MTTPYRFQSEDVRRMHMMGGRVLYAAEMGLGKTLSSLLYAQQHPQERPIVVVCPASLKWNWENEILKHVGWRSEILEGTRPPIHYLVPHKLVVLNYDILFAWLPYLKSLTPKLVILDEPHYCISRAARRTESVRQLCLNVPHVLALGATPLLNRPAELWPVLNILRPDLFPGFTSFAWEYCGPKKEFGKWQYKGASNLDKLHRLLSENLMIRRLKSEVLKDLPKKQRTIVPLPISNRKEYEHAIADFIGWLREKSPQRANRVRGKMERLAKVGYLLRLVSRLKRRAVIGWIEDWLAASDGKLIVSAVHRKMVSRLHKRWPQSSVIVDGSVVGRKRQIAFDHFLKNKKCRLLIGNIKAAGVGWSGKGVEAVAFAEYPWSPALVVQMEDRISGISRGIAGKRAQIFFLTAHNTIEEKVVKLLQSKQRTSCLILDGKDRGDALDIYDQLEKELLQNDRNA